MSRKTKGQFHQQKSFKGTPYGMAANMPTNSKPDIPGGPRSFGSWMGKAESWENRGIIRQLEKVGGTKSKSPAVIKRKKYFASDGEKLIVCYEYKTLLTVAQMKKRANIIEVNDRIHPKPKRKRSYTKTVITNVV